MYDNIIINIENKIIKHTRGVPKGSALSPILFIYYLNDILNKIKNKYSNKVIIQTFIDDLVIQANNIKDIQESFNDILSEINVN